MIVRVRVTEERLYDVVAESPEKAEELVRANWLSGNASGSCAIEKRGLPDLKIRAIDPRKLKVVK